MKRAIKAAARMVYVLEDSFGAPQAGVDVKEFDEYYELEEYLEANPDVMDRIEEGYATVREKIK